MGIISNLIEKHKNKKYGKELREELFEVIQNFNNFKEAICKKPSVKCFKDDIFMDLAKRAEENISVSVFLGCSREILELQGLLKHITKSLQYIDEYRNIWIEFIQHFSVNTTLIVAFVDVCEVETTGKMQYVLPKEFISFIAKTFLELKSKPVASNFEIRDVSFFDLKEKWKPKQQIIFC